MLEEIRPVLRGKQQYDVRSCCLQAFAHGGVAAEQVVDLLLRRALGPGADAGRMTAGTGKHNGHGGYLLIASR
jgi:hypothetical protein